MSWLWTVTQSRSSIVTKRESTRHLQKDQTSSGQKSHCVNTKDDTQNDGEPRTCTHSVSRLTVGVRTKARQTPSTFVTVSHGCTLRLYCKTCVSSGKVVTFGEPPIGIRCCLQVDVFQSFLVRAPKFCGEEELVRGVHTLVAGVVQVYRRLHVVEEVEKERKVEQEVVREDQGEETAHTWMAMEMT